MKWIRIASLALLSVIILPSHAQPIPPAGTQLIIQADQQVSAPQPIGTTLEEVNKSFNYDWTRYTSIKSNQNKAGAVESLLNTITDPAKLDPKQRQFAGELLLKLGAFYINTGRPDLAIPLLQKAEKFLSTPADQATLANLIAFAHERNFATSHDLKEMPAILAYTNKVIQQLYPTTKNEAVAFAWSIQGLAYNHAKDMKRAETCFRQAVAIYSESPDTLNEMSARARNKLAAIILTQPGHQAEAIKLLEPVKAFWLAQDTIYQTPYAARNFLTLGKAYLQAKDPGHACEEFSRALTLYKSFYGINNLLLIEPYQLLSKCSLQSGNPKAAELYQAVIVKLKSDVKNKEPHTTVSSGMRHTKLPSD